MATYIQKPFAINGDITEIPTETTLNGAVSFQQGYTQYYELDPATDPLAQRIERSKMNYLFNTITANIKEWQEQTFPAWISDSGSGTPFGYQIGAIVKYTDGNTYVSLVDSNTEEPTIGSNWVNFEYFRSLNINALPEKIIPDDGDEIVLADSEDSFNLKKMTLSNLFVNSKAINGYQKLPGGLIIQWGEATATAGGSVTFPISFPNSCFNVLMLMKGSENSVIYTIGITASSFTWGSNAYAATGYQPKAWFAIGY